MKKRMSDLSIDQIRIDGDTQPRVSINGEAVEDYAAALTNGASFPPVVVFHDGADYWLADGFHRLHAHRRIGAIKVAADVRQGTQKDAQLFAYAANQTHGLRRSNEDKRKAVAGMLALVPDWSDARIARHVGVSDKTVAAVRSAILGNSEDAPAERTVERAGATYTMQTGGIKQAVKDRAPPPILGISEDRQQQHGTDDYLIDELRAANQELLAENEDMAARLAVAGMAATAEERQAASVLISELRATVATLERDLSAVKVSRDGLMVENAELKRQVAYWRKRAEKVAA